MIYPLVLSKWRSFVFVVAPPLHRFLWCYATYVGLDSQRGEVEERESERFGTDAGLLIYHGKVG